LLFHASRKILDAWEFRTGTGGFAAAIRFGICNW
jgi:hypothetical protein